MSARTALVNAARGMVKSYGQRLPKCGTQQVSRELTAGLKAELREVLEPLLQEIESLNERIKEYDVRMEKIAKESYPQVELLKQVKGVGTQIALTAISLSSYRLHDIWSDTLYDSINLTKNEPLNAQTDSSNQAQLAATEPSTLS